MAGKTTPVLLVTANVGSIFEDPSHMLKIWTEEFLSTVARLDPKFIALHCQEVGGKNYERSMKHVEDFVRLFMSSEELRLFDKVRVFLDEDYSSAENFTALGNFYFIHESLSDVLIWDFAAMTFVSAKGKEVHSGNIEAVTTKEKSKFPQDFFPECKWSRKGFLRTRWSLNGTVFDLINIHLFHDASNFIAMESFPSVYSKNRRRALEHTLERFHNDGYGKAPFFVFGDFNFRTDTQGVINKLADGLSPVRVQSNKSNDHTKLQYKDDASQVVLSLGKKEFSHADHQSVFLDENGMWLKEFDREMDAFVGRLFEFAIAFQPSYPFEEDEKGGNNYMKTRCPAWCDRVILSNTAKTLVNDVSDPGGVEYGLMGPNTRMGDHKPVYLKMDLINDAGTVSCCTSCDTSSSDTRVLCFGNVAVCEPASWSCSSLSLKQSGSAPSSALTLRLDTSAAALATDCFLAPPCASLLHEPYTPESMETPSSSPIPVRIQRDFGGIEVVEWKCDDEYDDDDDERSDADITKNLHIDLTKMLVNSKEPHSVTPEVSSPKNFTSVQDHEFLSKESNRKPLPGSVLKYNSGHNEILYRGVPHVFICYSDTQNSHLNDTDSVEKKNATVLLNPELPYRSCLEGCEVKRFHEAAPEFKNDSTNKFCNGNQESSSSVLSTSSETLECRLNGKDTAFHEHVISSPLLKTFSLDCGIPSAASDSSSFPLNPQSMKEECIELVKERTNDTGDTSMRKTSIVVAENERADILSGINEEFPESSSVANCNNLCDTLSSHSQHVNVNERVVEETREDISGDTNLHSVPASTNYSAEINESKNSCTDLGTLNELSGEEKNLLLSDDPSESNINIKANHSKGKNVEKNNFPVSSQDCINVVSTEISSQLKRTKGRRSKHKKNIKLKPSSEKVCSSCCSLM